MRPWVSDEASSGERCLTALCGVSHSESHRHGDSPRILGTRSRVARPPVGLQRTHAACSRMPGSSRSAQEVSPGLSQSGARQARAVIPPAHLVTPHITSRMRRIGILATPSALRLREIASDPRYSIGISPGLIQNEDDIDAAPGQGAAAICSPYATALALRGAHAAAPLAEHDQARCGSGRQGPGRAFVD
eukprot:CAMPEP_0181220542 /NCGR_PEP_ID=MMETSP1096-20121128/28896_1 /TAXON_ID=156174 ORGANISM="Chrysochromulina ericina, Strain CCMP281" /NCGR_SAMPLE_ID=MMETSP1096 /ASSEMBLY_ACC=CAM_ASM_000453 /LENGTH=189 /DNA_ID=CAMNT_0023313059 /DNA_START=161 /DNA_END=731 /DNA_ORIENTATION=-